jgi:hypothetical protein
MHSFTVFSALAGASLALAKPLAAPAPAPVITPAPHPHMAKLALERRKTTTSESECESKADAIWEQAQSLDLDFTAPLAQWFISRNGPDQTAATWTQDLTSMCSVHYAAATEVPASLSSAYSSYLSASSSWANKAKPTIESVAKLCDGVTSAGLEALLVTDFDTCTSLWGAYISAAEAYASSLSSESSAPGTASSTGTHKPAATASTGVQPTQTSAPGTSSSTGAAGASAASSSSSTGAAPRETGFAVAAAAAVMAVAGAVVAL